jgi:acyl transferase domain-containing protein
MEHPLDSVFGVETPTFPQILPEQTKEVAVIEEKKSSGENLDDDFELARETIKDTLTTTQSAMTELLMIAQSSQHPRSFEVLATLASTMNQLSKQLVDLHKAKASIQQPAKAAQSNEKGVSVQNAVFVGSTEDLLKMISGKRSE